MNAFYAATRAIYARNVSQLGALCAPAFIASDSDFAFLLLIAARAPSRECAQYLMRQRPTFKVTPHSPIANTFVHVLRTLRDREGEDVARNIARDISMAYALDAASDDTTSSLVTQISPRTQSVQCDSIECACLRASHTARPHVTWKYIMHNHLRDTLYFPRTMSAQDVLYCAKYIGKYGTIANARSLITLFPLSIDNPIAQRMRLCVIVRVIVNALTKGSQIEKNNQPHGDCACYADDQSYRCCAHFVCDDDQHHGCCIRCADDQPLRGCIRCADDQHKEQTISTGLARIQFAHQIENMFKHDLVNMSQIIMRDSFIPYAPTDVHRAIISANLYQTHIYSDNAWKERSVIAREAQKVNAQYLAQCMLSYSRDNPLAQILFNSIQLHVFSNCGNYSHIVAPRDKCDMVSKTDIIAQTLRAYYIACYSHVSIEQYCCLVQQPKLECDDDKCALDWDDMMNRIFTYFARHDVCLCTDDITCDLDMLQIRSICSFTNNGQGVAIRTIHNLELLS